MGDLPAFRDAVADVAAWLGFDKPTTFARFDGLHNGGGDHATGAGVVLRKIARRQDARFFDGAFSRFAQRFAGLVDRTNSAELHLAALSYWLSVRLNALGSTVAGSTALALYAQSLANEDKLSPPEAGLVLTYAVSFTAAIIGLMRTYTELELSMNAVERIAEYLDLPPEPPLELESAVLC